MAFDQHIEADRIGDFNLFSAFVRVPLLILEGVLGQQSCESPKDRLDTNEHGEQSSQSECPDTDSGGPSRRALSHDNISSPHTRHDHVLQNRTNNELSRSSSSLPSCTDMMKSHGLKRSRKMSWSDESGLSLVEYSDESVRHEPASPYENVTSTTAPKPAMKKSSMTRSRSIRNNAIHADRTRYIPNMSKGGKGLSMPLRPNGSRDAAPGGEFSPQWGWYTTLTPPDVMYSANNSKTRRQGTEAGLQTASIIPGSPENRTNQVFQMLQNSKPPVGWTSVPI